MHVRAEEQPPLCLDKKQKPVRKEYFQRAMHGTAIDTAGAVEQCCPIGQQFFILVQLLIATQSGYATIEKYVLVSVGKNRVRPLQNLTPFSIILVLSTIGSPAVNIFDF